MTEAEKRAIELAERAVQLKRQIEAERAEAAERSKNRMGLGDTLKITGPTRPGLIGMIRRAVFWQRDEE